MENEQVLHGLFDNLIVLKTAYNYLSVDDLEVTLVECKENAMHFLMKMRVLKQLFIIF